MSREWRPSLWMFRPPTDSHDGHRDTLVLRMGKLSANYPVNKDAVVIGRPDSGVQSYPDLEIELG